MVDGVRDENCGSSREERRQWFSERMRDWLREKSKHDWPTTRLVKGIKRVIG